MTSWLLQPPEKVQRIHAITSPLPTKRPMQRLQSKLQVPRPNTASLSMGCQPSSVAKGTTWIAENLNPKRSKFSYREKPTKKQENHKAKLTNYHGGLSSFRKHRSHPTLSSTPFSRRQVSVTLAQASSVPRLLVSILQTLLSLSHSSLEQQTPLHI